MQRYTQQQLEKWLSEKGPIKGGAATVTYEYSGAGFGATTVAPTAAQAQTSVLLTCQLQMGDTDTTATITHNWGLSTTQNTGLMPLIKYWIISAPTTALPITFALGTNAVTVAKASATGSGGTWAIILEKPHTLVQ